MTAWSLTKGTIVELEAAGYVVFSVDPESFEGIAGALRLLGEVTGHADEGRKAAEKFSAHVPAAITGESGPTFYFEHSVSPLGTTGPETYTGEALRRAGGRNVFDGGWRLIEWESVLALDPEVILIAHDNRKSLSSRAGWNSLKAVKAGRVHFVSEKQFVYPTPRLSDGVAEAKRIFHAKNP